MTVARRLWVVLGCNALLLGAVELYHLRALHRVVRTTEQLTDVSARVVLSQARQSERVASLDETLAKYVITRDRGYLDKSTTLRIEFAEELARMHTLPMHADERRALADVERAWTHVDETAARYERGTPRATMNGSPGALRAAFDTLRVAIDALGDASQATMRGGLAATMVEVDTMEQVSWIVAGAALLFALISGLLLRRSITKPLRALSTGTRSVARGQFDHRLQTTWSDEFRQVATAFNAMTARLGELDRMKQEFVTNVSHDLKSPLASLRETNSLLLDEVPGPLRESQRRVLLLQRESADRLGVMIVKLLELSRMEAGLSLRFEPIGVRSFLHNAVRHAQVSGRERSVQVRLADDIAEALEVRADADRLRQLIDNLLENAVKFSPRGETVDVDATIERDRLLLSVADRGPGVDRDDAERIFERFHQTSVGRAVSGRGAGLGLTICREVVQAHRGRIAVVPREGGGSVFMVELPGARLPATREAAA